MTALRSDMARAASWLAYFALILGAWWWLYSQGAAMGMTLTGAMKMAMDGGIWRAGMTSLGVLAPMWIVMMAAMMGPTFVPSVRTYEDLIRSGAGTRTGVWGVISGYLAIWFGAGFTIALAHLGFVRIDLVSGMAGSASAELAAALLLVAGVYQFTDAKERCLAHCRSPMSHFLSFWRPGFAGGTRMGFRIGLYCIGCCWGIMLLGFVGGAMNLVWMGIATLIMTLEKLPDIGRWLTRPLGVCFLAAGVLQLTRIF